MNKNLMKIKIIKYKYIFIEHKYIFSLNNKILTQKKYFFY